LVFNRVHVGLERRSSLGEVLGGLLEEGFRFLRVFFSTSVFGLV
jgi:hypothetical protein